MAKVFKLHQIDPLTKQRESDVDLRGGFSPMDQPDFHAPPRIDAVPPTQMHPYLRRYVDEHAPLIEELQAFEDTVLSIRQIGYTKQADAKLRQFLTFFDEKYIPHCRREQTGLFSLLRERLLAHGEHSAGADPVTAVDLMEEEHIEAMQLAAVILNFMGLAFRFADPTTRLTVLDAALEQAKLLIELLRLHVFREDNVVFSLAHRLISATEFDQLQSKTTP
jgi:hemerythrin-like domain-containing protein